MKTWILVWFLLSPPNDDGATEWEYGVSRSMTQEQCETQLAEDDLQYLLLAREGILSGHEIYCKDMLGTRAPILRL
jgi:hypothetical protein